MRANTKSILRVMSAFAIGLMATSASHAATIPGSITTFVSDDVFTVKAKSWSDPAFGNKGWTHSSDWGNFNAVKGQVITITAMAADAGIHPGMTIWYRGVADTAPDNYVVDHFYPQNASFTQLGVVDATGAALGDIVMKYITHGYDLDNNMVDMTVPYNATLKGKTDNVPGQLVMSFKAPYTGNYMFVVGGFNPDATIDTTLKYNVGVKVKFAAVPAAVTP